MNSPSNEEEEFSYPAGLMEGGSAMSTEPTYNATGIHDRLRCGWKPVETPASTSGFGELPIPVGRVCTLPPCIVWSMHEAMWDTQAISATGSWGARKEPLLRRHAALPVDTLRDVPGARLRAQSIRLVRGSRQPYIRYTVLIGLRSRDISGSCGRR